MMRPGEVPKSIWIPAHPTNYRQRPALPGGGSYDLIVIHITSGRPSALPVAQMWQEPDHKSSAHFVIGQDGTLLQCVPLRMAALHAHQANARSVGVEHCAREPKEFGPLDPGLPPSEIQLKVSAKLVAYLLVAGGFPPTREYVKGHAEADPQTTHTNCPDAAPWPWTRYMEMVDKEHAAILNPPPPTAA